MARARSEPRGSKPDRYRPEVAALVTEMLDGRPDVTPRICFGVPGFLTRGRMFACVSGAGIALKLPPERIAELTDPVFSPFAPGPRPMGGWVAVSRPGADEFAADAGLLDEAIAYVSALATDAVARPKRRSGAA